MVKNNRILIVDDQEDLREQLGKLLISCGQPNKTSSLVQSMRDRLMGIEPEKSSSSTKVMPKYDIDTAGQGEEAFEMVQAAIDNGAPYALMFTDMRMPPGWDGLKTAKKVREIDKNIEIVIMTAYADHSQEEVSQEVGMPEKLLYIKKPFQAEEVFQLAMSLTAKWSSEKLERMRRLWLEKTLVCMRAARQTEDPHSAALDSFITFLNTDKGLVAQWDKSKKNWKIKDKKGVDEAFAKKFLKDNSKHLQESNAIQNNVDGVYVVPLKNKDFSVIVGICGAKSQADPEWYKLLNLLVMTSIEGLETASIKARSTDTCQLMDIVKEIRSEAEALEKKYESDSSVKKLVDKVRKLIAATEKK